MGGGGFDIHYGIFRKPTDTVYEASKATNDRLLTCLDWTHPVTKDSVVLDLGSGHGGISHEVRASKAKARRSMRETVHLRVIPHGEMEFHRALFS
jgi:hypothetical protein